MTAPRVVLDTNCVVSALVFSRGRLSWLREDWQAGRFTALVSRETVTELLRVLNYPKFKLDRDEQEALLADYLPYAETVNVGVQADDLPAVRDKDDTPFLQLALAARADVLVSGDGDLQTLKAGFRVPILTANEFAEWLQSYDNKNK